MSHWHRNRPSPKKTVTPPYRVVTHGSRQHVVERYRGCRGKWGDYQDWEEIAQCTTRALAQQIYARKTVEFVEETLR